MKQDDLVSLIAALIVVIISCSMGLGFCIAKLLK